MEGAADRRPSHLPQFGVQADDHAETRRRHGCGATLDAEEVMLLNVAPTASHPHQTNPNIPNEARSPVS